MKAQEYYDKYFPRIFGKNALSREECTQISVDILSDFCNEAVAICDLRRARQNNAVAAVIREQNEKWLAMCRIFRKKIGVCPF